MTFYIWIAALTVEPALAQTQLPGITIAELGLAGRSNSERVGELLNEKLRVLEKLAETIVVQSQPLAVDATAYRVKVEGGVSIHSLSGSDTISGGIYTGPVPHHYQLILGHAFPMKLEGIEVMGRSNRYLPS